LVVAVPTRSYSGNSVIMVSAEKEERR